MPDTIFSLLHETAWPVALALAWMAGELGHRWLALPRISSYGIVGFLLGSAQGGLLPDPNGGPVTFLADVAFGLILFELGYRINLRWVRANPWLGVTSVLEACCSFAAVFFIAHWFAVPLVPALLLSALAMSTSPAAVLRVANELHSSGQVTERTLHLSAFNSVLAVIAFKMVMGYWVLSGAGGVFQALWSSLVVLIVPALLRALGGMDRSATVAFAVAVLVLTAFTHTLKFSPLLATLAFGVVARHRRVVLSQAQRNFGVLGDLLTMMLFVFVAASLHWKDAIAGIELALAVIAARMAVKVAATTLLARLGGITWRKGFLTGLALMPQSVFAIVLLEQSRHLGLDLLSEVAAIAAIVLLLGVIGPLVTQRALVWAGEAPKDGAG
jgi:Kef-type K+ transport system membrane component KefB